MKHEQLIQAVLAADGVHLQCSGLPKMVIAAADSGESMQYVEARMFPDIDTTISLLTHVESTEFYVVVYGDSYGMAMAVYDTQSMADKLYDQLVTIVEG